MTWPASLIRPAAPGIAPRLLGALALALAGLRRALPPRPARPAFVHVSLLPGQALTLRRGGGTAGSGMAGLRAQAMDVEVLSGRIWLTRSGHAADHMLVGGQRLGIAAPGRVVVQAMGREPAWLRVTQRQVR